jgi:hypothetical protein
MIVGVSSAFITFVHWQPLPKQRKYLRLRNGGRGDQPCPMTDMPRDVIKSAAISSIFEVPDKRMRMSLHSGLEIMVVLRVQEGEAL